VSVERLSERPDQRRALRRTWPLLRAHRLALAAAAAVSLLATAAQLAVPVLAGVAVDAVVGADRGRLEAVAVAFAVLAVAQLVLERARLVLAARAGEAFLLDLRERVTAKLLERPLAFFDRHRPGEVLARATTDVASLSSFVRGGLRQLLDGLLLIGVTLAVLLVASPPLALLSVLAVAPTAWALRRFHRDSTVAYARYTQAEAGVAAAAGELVAARETLQATGGEAVGLDRARRADAALLDANDAALRADNRLSVIGFWQLAALAIVVVAGGLLARAGRIEVGFVVTFVLALRQLFDPVASLAWLYGEAQQARANLARLLELLERPTPPRGRLGGGGAGLALERVTFGYDPAAPVLRGVTLTLAAGEQVALTGPTGAGKSTAAKLLAGLLFPDRGRVTLGGVDLRDLDPGALRRRVMLVPQEGHLLDGTLADNLRLVPGEHTDEDLRVAVERAGLSRWVAGLPGGLSTPLGHRGAALSAGERQLVALARAALAAPDVLILDEATAAVDPATEAVVARALARVGSGRTLVVVAHRPATAARYPRRIHIDGGRFQPDLMSPDRRFPTGHAMSTTEGARR